MLPEGSFVGHKICSNSEIDLFKIILHIRSPGTWVSKCLHTRVSQPQHSWHFGPDNSLLWGLSCHCRTFGGISGLYSLDINRTRLLQPKKKKMSLDITKRPLGNNNLTSLRTSSLSWWVVSIFQWPVTLPETKPAALEGCIEEQLTKAGAIHCGYQMHSLCQ